MSVNDLAEVRTSDGLRVALKALRERKHLSYDTIVRRSGIGKTTLSDILNAKTNLPQWGTLELVLKACEVSPKDLAAWEQAHRRASVAGIGQPLEQITDPFALEVHAAITGSSGAQLTALPPYVPRPHDAELADVVAGALAGVSGIAVLVGGSSAGKTRGLWEALAPLRAAGGWRLWHPVFPTRSESLADLDRVRARTVVWLNETQRYLWGEPGDRAATALQALLDDPSTAPVLVVGTLWPEHHGSLSSDPATAAAKLLRDHEIEVPHAFTGEALHAIHRAAAHDERLADAVEHAEDNQITQYLAGGPELVRRYRFSCSPTAKAIIEVAMDAIQLGHPNDLSFALLRDAAPHYLLSVDRANLSDDWLEKALAETAQPSKGVRGPLTRINPLPTTVGQRRRHRSAATPAGPQFRLADYLDHYGRRHRSRTIAPIGLWEALADHAPTAHLNRLGEAAHARGLYFDAAQLWKNATRHGDARAATSLLTLMAQVTPEDLPTEWVIEHVTDTDSAAVCPLLAKLQELADPGLFDVFIERVVTTVRFDRSTGAPQLLAQLRKTASCTQLQALARRAATTMPVEYGGDASALYEQLLAVGSYTTAEEFAGRATAAMPLDEPFVAGMIEQLLAAGSVDLARALTERALASRDARRTRAIIECLDRWPDHAERSEFLQRATSVTLDNPWEISALLETLHRAGAEEQFDQLSRRAATSVALGDGAGAGVLLVTWWETRSRHAIREFLSRITDIELDHGGGLALLLTALQMVGAHEEFTLLAQRAADRCCHDEPANIAMLLYALHQAGAYELARQVARQAASTACGDARGLAQLLDELQRVGTPEQVTELARRAAATAPLQSPLDVAVLMTQLHRAGTVEELADVAARAATTVAINDLGQVRALLEQYRIIGANSHIDALLHRVTTEAVPYSRFRQADQLYEWLAFNGNLDHIDAIVRHLTAAGQFDKYLHFSGMHEKYRFGRDPDGTPAEPWCWTDLA
ncbi:helix-turn-helix transcriptional regulator [Nocardia sp. NPDC046763]|uniref:helix-turn-helix transcriptional regulator n=1 Tax=Nocardia sp. NPDC046763 TaxID=3155256 RepID=UPI0033DC0A25